VTSRAAAALVRVLPRATLVVGKGGVGKTTCAAALALESSRAHSTLVVTTDPARALPTVLDHEVGAEPTPLWHRLAAQTLEASSIRARFLERWGHVIRAILDRGTYLDDSDIGPLVDTAMPGGDEIFAALALAELMADARSPFERIIVDTAPTGHTLRLLNLPATFRALLRLLTAMQEKHRFMVRTLTRTYKADAADEFLAHLGSLVTALETSLHDARHCSAVMVANAQPVVVEETKRYLAALDEMKITVAAVVWNAWNASDTAGNLPTRAPQYRVPRLAQWPIGRLGLDRWLDAFAASDAADARSQPTQSTTPKSGDRASVDFGFMRPLTIVAGKGGVGKTTVASALAIVAAERGRTLVVSTDPAPSLADTFAQDINDAEVAVHGVERLGARQMDASAAFNRLRAEYQTRVDAIFDGLVGRGVDLAHDRAVARDLLALAPPGVDEVYALSLLADAVFGGQYATVVVDPAPTGHLLRLLEMPALALAWTHQIMRLMLKYKEVAGLGESAQDLLDFSRTLRTLDSVLRDPARCAVVLVSLDEPVVRAETERLAAELARRETFVSAVILNRAGVGAALPAVQAPVQLQTPTTQPPPAGVRALRAWAHSWRTLGT
jgi:arsenite-transporting ATPase